MTTTIDLREFGCREPKMAAELSAANCENPPEFLGDGVHLMMNDRSVCVFLADEVSSVAMLNGGKLEQWLSCPECGAEGSPRTCRTIPAVTVTWRSVYRE